tara:strand:- start:12389 stop:12685 length:297 start_codon:yes stop_codon:yes gene_type:complete
VFFVTFEVEKKRTCLFSPGGLEWNSRLPQATGGNREIERLRNHLPESLPQANSSFPTTFVTGNWDLLLAPLVPDYIRDHPGFVISAVRNVRVISYFSW